MPAARLDITQFPYSVTQPWQGNDASVPNPTAAIQQAIDDLAANGWGLMDTGGTDGGVIDFPPWVVGPITDTLVMRDGVRFAGNNNAASRLMMGEAFPGTTTGKHMINLGAGNPNARGYASFGGGIKDLNVSARLGVVSAAHNYTIYSRNVQDSGAILDNVVVDGGTHFGGFKYMEGDGGASLIKVKDIQVRSRKQARAIGNLPMVVKVSGSTMFEIDGFEPYVGWEDDNNPGFGAVASSYGLLALGGNFHIKRVHGEAVKWPIYFGEHGGSGTPGGLDWSPPTDTNCQAYVEFVTGGAGNERLVWEDGAKWHGKITLDHVMLKTPSIPYSFYSTSRSSLNKTADIIDRIRL
jgi:hypothetical protein